jgi:prepilin-type N-terminal cleavage/methylation domain-containing protein
MATSSAKGYSLIELLVACALVGVVLSAASTRLPVMLNSFALQNATFQIANDLRLARARAIATNGKGRITFASTTYQARRESPVGSGTYVSDGALQSLPTGITVASNPVNPTFDSRGLMTQTYTITLTSPQSHTKTIALTALGRISVQ